MRSIERTATAICFAGIALLAMSPAAFAASATPAMPMPTASIADGFVSLAGGAAQFGDNKGDEPLSGLSVEGAASGEYNFTTTLGFQGDAVFRSQQRRGDDGSAFDTRELDGALHAFYRNPGQFLIGGFVQAGSTDLFRGGSPSAETYDRYYGGAEGQAFFGNLTLYAQLGAQQYQFGTIETDSGLFGNFEARYFLMPNLRIDAYVGARTLKPDAIDNTVRTFTAGIGGEYRLDQSPVSVFAKYDFTQGSFDDDDEVDYVNRVLVGLKFNFGSETLEDRDRSGASLQPVEDKLIEFPTR